MNQDDSSEQEKLIAELQALKTKHRQLDVEINALRETGAIDMLKLGRMKKIKLKLKDQIAAIEDSLTPDIIA